MPYFHVVFTLPRPLGPLALQNKRAVYGILFRAASETLLTIAADPRHLGARIGFTAVLHTWGQTLEHHPHVHCVVPGGGISADEDRWVASRRNFFLPVRVLGRLFRGSFLHHLRKARREGRLSFHGQLEPLSRPGPWSRYLKTLRQTDWVVYSKAPFAGPERVLKYLARYTHRTAISNRRLLSFRQGRVAFRYKDYRQANRTRSMNLQADEFIRRFLLHVLPKGFMRIRHYGFLANCHRRQKLDLCRRLLGEDQPPPAEIGASAQPPQTEACPACRKGRLVLVDTLPALADGTEPRMNSPGT